MTLAMPVVWTERHRGHATDGGYWLGVRLPGDEEPERGDALLAGLGDVTVVEPDRHGLEPVLAVHDEGFVRFLADAHRAWVQAGHPTEPGQPQVVGYIHPRGRVVRPATTVRAQVGWYAGDTMTLIGEGTWEAAMAAVDGALTAARLVLDGAPAAYAAVRPPGHHAGPDYYGGSCYLNNAAVAANRLAATTGSGALIDLDAHHGNGTQDIFWTRADVHYASLHVDPAAGWYPHYCGHADERGEGPGRGANHNEPLAPGSGDDAWLAALDRLLDGIAGGSEPDWLVVSLGVDAAADDPESPLEVTAAGFTEAGRHLAAIGRPTVFVQEGGYHLPTLGPLVRAVLDGFESAR